MNRATLLEAELERTVRLAETQIDRYLEWPNSMRHGDVMHTIYGDMIDFVNFRVETATSAIELIRAGRVADSLALARGLLENYLLLILMTRGTKFFLLQHVESWDSNEFKNELAKARAEFEAQKESLTNGLQDVRPYSRSSRTIMYVFEGLRSGLDVEDEMVISWHYFRFREFRPETMRLIELLR
jgi:hypothetical protein